MKSSSLLTWLALGLIAWIAYEKFLKPANAASGSVPSAGPGPQPVRLPTGLQPVTYDPNAMPAPNIHLDDPAGTITELDMSTSNY